MSEELVPMIIMPAFFYLIGFIFRTLSDNRVRRELVNANADTETIEKLFLKARSENPDGSLKWGMVAVAIGLALLVIQLFGLTGEDPITYGFLFLFGGAGLCSFYLYRTANDIEDV